MASRLRTVTTRSGHAGVEIEGPAYHSPYTPQREAEKFYRAEPIEKADVILHFGWGLGYTGAVLRERLKPSAPVLVFEPDEDLFKMYLDQPDSQTTARRSCKTHALSSLLEPQRVSFSTTGLLTHVKKPTNSCG
jgi:hypothetical protein